MISKLIEYKSELLLSIFVGWTIFDFQFSAHDVLIGIAVILQIVYRVLKIKNIKNEK